MADNKTTANKTDLSNSTTKKYDKIASTRQPTNKPTTNENDKKLNDLYKIYLNNVTKVINDQELELEVKFGTLDIKTISKINFDNVMKKLLSLGFIVDNNVYLLRIQNEYIDTRTRRARMSTIRTEISGLQNIRKYCQTNSIDRIETGISYIQKSGFSKDMLTSVNMNDFNFRVSLNKEVKLEKTAPFVRTTIDKWNDNKKTFRYLNRFKLRHPSLPVVVDMSIVKNSKRQGRNYVPEYNIHDSEVFNSDEKYEIEIECVNSLVGLGTAFYTSELLNTNVFKPVIKYILAGLQETNYPVSYSEQKSALTDYMKLLWGKKYNETMKINSSNFVGPSSYTLEMKNILPINTDAIVPNIRENYTVTDKADGDRKLLFIVPNGKIYLINTNLDVQFTGTRSKNNDLWNTLIDGEHVLYDKNKKFINMYAAFDIYYVGGDDIRAKGFAAQNAEELNTNYRLPILETVIEKMNVVSVVNESSPAPLKIVKKRFYLATETQDIFTCCSSILAKERDNLFEYETDGLIFTPANRGVASDKIGEYIEPFKMTWEYSFKWKPAKYNTIDFLVSVKKNENGSDIIGSIFNDGINLTSSTQINEYKTVILRVGFNESNPNHGYINPYQDVIDDKIPTYLNYEERKRERKNYVPMQFYPTEPSDYKAGICNIPLTGVDKNMYTENEEIIEDNMIVEFSYDFTKDKESRWVPLRVRYDKTAQLRAGEKMFGNAFHVANSNWHSIHNPITTTMIMTGNIPEILSDDDVYYNKVSGSSKTQALKDFHNLYVKSLLVKSVAKPGMTLIDLAVGKGGDWPKWIDAKLKFVFGVDLSRDNIQNRLNGAYARYLNYRKTYRVMPSALFVNGNSSVNIRNTNGIMIDKDKQITKAVFGQGPKDAKMLGQGVYKNYGVASEGFDVCSIQFAIHYMFESHETLHNFLRNVSEVTKEGGYFIGTSYDGHKIFNMLKNTEYNDSKIIMVNDDKTGYKKRIWELTKRYNQSEFNDDESCVGYAIDVFQESINKTIREYLVNYTYLTRILENYGFVLASSEDLKFLNSAFTSPTGFFNELFNKMNEDIKKNGRVGDSYKNAPLMTDEERTISFLNRYFIYKKVRKVSDVGKISLNLQHKTIDEENDEDKGTRNANNAVASIAKNNTDTNTTDTNTTATNTTATNTTATNTTATNTTATNTITKKLKLNKKPKLTTINEEASLKSQNEDGADNIIQTQIIEKPTVTKLKRVLKISKQ